ncbi:MAG: hypothetical protein L6Q66_10710, partial [Bacteroidia bacterium]|nr:hypothetical protein [Bacteroidia bacterium]
YMGRYSYKKIGYKGLKSLAHLHPNHFKPDRSKLKESIRDSSQKYYFIRCVSATSTHDVGKQGMTDRILKRIVDHLEPHGKVIINSQRQLPVELKKYELDFEKADIAHYIANAEIFISDSTTMCAEACVLGTPAIEVDDWYADFEQYKLLNGKYELLQGYTAKDEDKILLKLSDMINNRDLQSENKLRRDKFIDDHIDLSGFMIWLFDNYPQSVAEYFRDPSIQNKFK